MSISEPQFGSQNDDPELDDLEQQLLQICNDEEPTPSSSRTFDFLTEEQQPDPEREKLDKILIGNDSDSSDDEEIRNFLEQKYNEYGRDIHMSMKKKDEDRKIKDIELEVSKNILGCDKLKITPQLPALGRVSRVPETEKPLPGVPKLQKIKEEMESKKTLSVYTDPIFGMSLVKPLISSTLLQERMKDKEAVSMFRIKTFVDRLDKTRDWVFGGAIVNKSPVRTSQKGDQYSIWTLSDLKNDIKTCSLFLFKAAHRDLWKTPQGMVVAVLNPNILERRNDKTEANLSIATPEKLMLLGQSKDLGICKSKKKNGEPCTSIVNLSVCDHCVFHMQKEFKSLSKRSELQSATAGRGLNELRNKVLGKNEVFYGGQSFTAIAAKKNAKQVAKDNQRMLSLSEYFGRNSSTANSPGQRSQDKIRRADAVAEVNNAQRQKDIQRLAILKAASEPVTPPTTPTAPEKPPIAIFSKMTPTLSKSSFTIDVSTKASVVARAKAAEVLKKKPIDKANPNFIKYRGTDSGKKRVLEEMNQDVPSAKRAKAEEEAKRDRIQRIMAATSSHMDLVDRRECEETQKYFNTLEKKEALEEKMLSTYKVACKAVACRKCKYLAFSAAPRCLEERHPLKVIDTDKRFFKCGDCGNRTATVHRMPKFSCKNCQSSRWEPTSMIRERIVASTGDKLSIRGDEEQFIGTTTAGNINLLVPNEE
ncbi:protein MCM10 homolog [Phlebotomus argentipes]|uniref:protein MCM10 homolog n=1 Tax=Phlebotomus argentipes TaxID=94469 RepID=UPI0028936D6B|nr:protein MCM10 homolog [Phlebotomus argentipes]